MNNAPCGASHRPAPCAIACKAVKPLLLSVSAPRGSKRKSPCRKCGSDAAIYGGFDTIRSKPPLPDRASYQLPQKKSTAAPSVCALCCAISSASALKSVAATTATGRSARKSVVQGKRVSVRVDLGGRGNIKNKTTRKTEKTT